MELQHLGFNDWFSEQAEGILQLGQEVARVFAVERRGFLVRGGGTDLHAEVSGRFQFDAASPTDFPCVGDWVCIEHASPGSAVIHSVLPRKSFLRRKRPGKAIDFQMIAANMDVAFIVQSCHFDFNPRRLDRYLVACRNGNIEPIILLNKRDLLSTEEVEDLVADLRGSGVTDQLLPISSKTGQGLERLHPLMEPARTYGFIGSSGVGKSSLINALLGEEQLDTQEVSGTGEGTHTTTRRELLLLESGAMVIDTPGMRADARNTDNLRGMREVAVYLFAEESGNELIRELYKQRIRRTAFSFWDVGNGEWDSSTYLGHTMSAYINLYDFAKDPEVRGYAKAIMDFLFTRSAVKYRRGAWGGPQVRDYGDAGMWSTSPHTTWLYFGDAKDPKKKELEHALFFTSAYRPPAAVTAFARKDFKRPLEIFASHPNYENFLPGKDEAPLYHETQYFGNHFQLGTMREGHGYNRNGFKLLSDHPELGVAFVIPSTGKLRNGVSNTAGGDVIVQNGPGALYWNPRSVPYHVMYPNAVSGSKEGDIFFLDLGKSWAAFLPVELTRGENKNMKKSQRSKGLARMVQHGEGKGLLVQVGEQGEYHSFEAFKSAVKKETRVEIKEGHIHAQFSNGRSLTLSKDGKTFSRDGKPVNWEEDRKALLQPASGETTPLSLGWKERKLVVEAGGHRFEAELKEDGTYVFESKLGSGK